LLRRNNAAAIGRSLPFLLAGRLKFQIPIPKTQGNPKLESQKIAGPISIGIFLLVIAWDLGFGIWNFAS